MAAGSQSVEWLGEKAGPSPAREKNPFFLRSHAVQLARVSRKNINEFSTFFFFNFLHSHVPSFIVIFPKPPETEVACTKWAESLSNVIVSVTWVGGWVSC